jgi:hypothetical protein
LLGWSACSGSTCEVGPGNVGVPFAAGLNVIGDGITKSVEKFYGDDFTMKITSGSLPPGLQLSLPSSDLHRKQRLAGRRHPEQPQGAARPNDLHVLHQPGVDHRHRQPRRVGHDPGHREPQIFIGTGTGSLPPAAEWAPLDVWP